MLEDAAAWGIDADLLPPMEDWGGGEFEVWEENWEALGVFSACSTQWNYGQTGATGISYPSLCAVMDLLEVEDKPAVFRQVQIIELGALVAMANSR